MSEMGQANSHSVPGLLLGRLVRNFRRREQMTSGAILTRPSRCEGRDPQLLCPVCSVSPVVRELVVLGKPNAACFKSPNLIWSLRSTGARVMRPAAHKLGAHSLERRAVRASVSAGGAFASTRRSVALVTGVGVGWWGVCLGVGWRQLLRAGQWSGDAARPYLDLTEGERRATAGFVIEGSGDKPV